MAAAVEVGVGSLGAAAGSLLLSALLLGIIINSPDTNWLQGSREFENLMLLTAQLGPAAEAGVDSVAV